jgi:hypothetical protein
VTHQLPYAMWRAPETLIVDPEAQLLRAARQR